MNKHSEAEFRLQYTSSSWVFKVFVHKYLPNSDTVPKYGTTNIFFWNTPPWMIVTLDRRPCSLNEVNQLQESFCFHDILFGFLEVTGLDSRSVSALCARLIFDIDLSRPKALRPFRSGSITDREFCTLTGSHFPVSQVRINNAWKRPDMGINNALLKYIFVIMKFIVGLNRQCRISHLFWNLVLSRRLFRDDHGSANELLRSSQIRSKILFYFSMILCVNNLSKWLT